jgi:hypothetical protein
MNFFAMSLKYEILFKVFLMDFYIFIILRMFIEVIFKDHFLN